MRKQFTNEDINFLNEFYPTNGLKFCAEKLNRTESSIQHKVIKLKLSVVNGHRKERYKSITINRDFYNKKYNINETMFFDIKEPIVSYFLGLLWADGNIISKGVSKENSIRLEGIKSDLIELLNDIAIMGKWTVSTRLRSDRKEQMLISTNNRKLVDFLIDNDYKIKSGVSADKILSKISDNLKPYFFRGLSDGDGCFYQNKKNSSTQFSIYSTYDQDWFYVENLFNILNIKYSIIRTKLIKSKTSAIRITNKADVIKFGNYIYQNNIFGYSRKYQKYISINDVDVLVYP